MFTAPEPFRGHSQWKLLGCYHELEVSPFSRHLSGSYASLADIVDLTLPRCFEACERARAQVGETFFTHAGLGNNGKCLCGITLSELPTPHNQAFCSSPCSNPSCENSGYVVLYEFRPAFEKMNLPSKLLTISRIYRRDENKIGMWVGIAVGIFFGILLLLLGIWFVWRHCHRLPTHPTHNEPPAATLGHAPSTLRRKATNASSHDGRRHAVVMEEEYYLNPLDEISEAREQRTRRGTMDAWKTGVVPVSKHDDATSGVEVGAVKKDKFRKGTLADGAFEIVGGPESRLEGLGLSYVDSRLAELESERRVEELGNRNVGMDRLKGESSSDGSRQGKAMSDEQWRNDTRMNILGMEMSPPVEGEEHGIGVGVGSSREIMGREGAESIAWWEKRNTV